MCVSSSLVTVNSPKRCVIVLIRVWGLSNSISYWSTTALLHITQAVYFILLCVISIMQVDISATEMVSNDVVFPNSFNLFQSWKLYLVWHLQIQTISNQLSLIRYLSKIPESSRPGIFVFLENTGRIAFPRPTDILFPLSFQLPREGFWDSNTIIIKYYYF